MWREDLFCIQLLLGNVEGMLGRLYHHLENTVVTVTEAKKSSMEPEINT